jgi:hypothetical protein
MCADLVLSDPPWKVQETSRRKEWFDQLVRITKPEGRIIHNAGWIPDHDHATRLDESVRVDDDVGTATYLTLFRKETPPGENTDHIQQAYRGAASLSHIDEFGDAPTPSHHTKAVYRSLVAPPVESDCANLDGGTVDPRLLDPSREDLSCPQCDHSSLQPLSLSDHAGTLYECPHCGFRARPAETAAGGDRPLS